MTELTPVLTAIEEGDARSVNKPLPLVYGAPRRLAAQKLAPEKPRQTPQATVLVYEACVQLVGVEKVQDGNSRGALFRREGRGDAADSC